MLEHLAHQLAAGLPLPLPLTPTPTPTPTPNLAHQLAAGGLVAPPLAEGARQPRRHLRDSERDG